MHAAILFATELYALPILRPLARAAEKAGIATAWIVPDAVAHYLEGDETRLASLAAARRFKSDAIWCGANWVMPQLPGIKVQIFHGFNAEKRDANRGHFRLRGFFDLYCTQGPATTEPFVELARSHRYFAVQETGWPKLDPLFAPTSNAIDLRPTDGKPVIMYASTFTTGLSAAPVMLEPLKRLIARKDKHWLLTLHPKCDAALIAQYKALACDNATFLDSTHLIDMLRAADVLVCDTSSVIDEFAVQLKPVVTIRNRVPKPFMLDVPSVDAVAAAIEQALAPSASLKQALRQHAEHIHPTRDGQASERIIDATQAFLDGKFDPLQRKPWNVWRRWQAHSRKKELLHG